MAISGAIALGAVAVGYTADQQRQQRHAAEDQAKAQQNALDALQKEISATTKELPTPDSDAVLQARRRSIASQISRRGRASTVLTQGGGPSDALGGG